MLSKRFGKTVYITDHAKQRMTDRHVSEATIAELVETGKLKRKDERHLWLFKHYPDRSDNLVCAAAVENDALVIKTLMTHWQERSP